MNNSKILDESGSSQKRKVFSLGTYEGHRYFEVEEYYLDRRIQEWKKKKGVSINKDAYSILRNVIVNRNEEILSWLNVNYVPENIARYEELQNSAAERSGAVVGERQVGGYKETRDPRFADIKFEGGVDRVLYNHAHPLSAELSDAGPAAEAVVSALLQAFHRARTLLAGTPAVDSETLLTHLEHDWAKFLKDALKKDSR
jgi:hypothetical protein